MTYDPRTLPMLMPVRRAVEISGLSRTEVYDRLNAGDIAGRHARRSTMVETQSMLDWINKLPRY
jgi:hypothetical protein